MIELITLYPILKFPRLVANVGAPLEHRNYNDLNWNRLLFGKGGYGDQYSEGGSEEAWSHAIS